MNTMILIPRFSLRSKLNEFWRTVRRTYLGPYVCHEAQAVAAMKFLQGPRHWAELAARSVFGRPLCGAGYGWESRQPLVPNVSGTNPVVTSGANLLNHQVSDYCSVEDISFAWQVAGTVTALVLFFDSYTAPNAIGTKTAGLTGTQADGTLTAPSVVASQAVGSVLYKNLSNTLDIDLLPGNSVQALVNTTTTAGSGVPVIIVVPRAETYANLAAGFSA
jgi:hypothetical protein